MDVDAVARGAQPRRPFRSVLWGAALAALSVVAVTASTPSVQAVVPTIRFAAAGDFAATSSTSAVLGGIRAAAPDLTLALGDLSYGTSTGEQAWCDFVTARVGAGHPFELISGNHESDGLNGDINDFSACLPNQLPGVVGTYGRQWYVDHPRQSPTARFIMISPGLTFPEGPWSYAAGSERYDWTAAAIDGARAAGIPWVVVGVHKPCLTMGQYLCDGQSDINDLLVAKRVDLVLNGHEHLYQRSKQLAHSASCPALKIGSYEPACVADGDDALTKGAGTVFATVGTGGTYLRDVGEADTEAGYFRAWSGANRLPSHGFLDVTADAEQLRARFVAASGTFSDAFAIAPSLDPAVNQPPTASFPAPTCTGTTCTFDGTASRDADGTLSHWSWSFGDGTSATGRQVTRTYAAAGTYAVGLTVTDDRGATHTTTRPVPVGTAPTLASDSFSRTVAGGFGAADRGGSWLFSGPSSDASVASGTGRLLLRSPGAGQAATLPGTGTSTRTDVTLTLRWDKIASGSGTYAYVRGRRVGTAGNYRARVRLVADGSITVALDRNDAAFAQTTIVPDTAVPGLTYVPGEPVRVRLQVLGTSPTTLRAKVWRAGTAEPASWLVAGSDATAALQAAGDTGLQTYLSSSAANAPVTVTVDDLTVVAPPP